MNGQSGDGSRDARDKTGIPHDISLIECAENRSGRVLQTQATSRCRARFLNKVYPDHIHIGIKGEAPVRAKGQWSSQLPGDSSKQSGSRDNLYYVGNYRALSKKNWKVDCSAGEVTATSPQGVVYDFGNISTDVHLGKFAINELITGSVPTVPARTASYMDTKTATDVNGNWLSYTYQLFGTAMTPWTMPGLYDRPFPDNSALDASSSESPS